VRAMSAIKKNNPILFISVIAIFSKLVGMLRDVVLANYFGTSNISDAYLIASSVPTLLFYFIGHSIATAYMPMYNRVKHERGEKHGLAYTNSIINISLVISTLFVLLILIWPEAFISLFASGFDGETSKITAELMRMSVASIYLMCLISVLGGYLNAHKSFIIPASISLPRNAILISSIVIASLFGFQWLGWGLLISYMAELLLLLPFAIKKGYRYTPGLKFNDTSIKETWYIVLPILVGMFVGQINKIIDRSLASVICDGGVSALTYASVINNAVQEVLVTGIITVLFSHCAEWVAKGEHYKVKTKLSSVLNVLIMLLLPATAGVLLLSEPIVVLLLGRGEFNASSIAMTSGTLSCYTLGLTFLAVRDTLVKVFYAYKKTKITTTVSIISILINIILNFILYHYIGLNGLALATSLSAVFNSVTLYVFLRKYVGDFGLRDTLITILKSLLACCIMAIAVYFAKNSTVNLSGLVSLLVCIFAGASTYFITALILRISPLIDALKKLGLLKAEINTQQE